MVFSFSSQKFGFQRTDVSPLQNPQGHFFVEPIVNGTRLRMMVDTGASFVVLSREDARHIGISPAPGHFTTRVKTANGVVLVVPVVLKEVAIGEVAVRDVSAAVLPGNILRLACSGCRSSRNYRISRWPEAGAADAARHWAYARPRVRKRLRRRCACRRSRGSSLAAPVPSGNRPPALPTE